MTAQAMNIRTLLEAGVHFGHLTRSRNPKMAKYIFGVQNKINIINLDATLPMFQAAIKQIQKVASKGGRILFVATKRQASKLVAEYAAQCGMPYVNYRWLGGMLTNYKTIKQSIKRLNTIKKLQEDDKYKRLTKKERLNITREMEKLENSLGGIKDMGGLPDLLFVIDVGNENIAIKEANRLGIPVVGVVDTNNDPDGVDFVIPGNDDALRSIRLYLQTVADVISAAREERKAKALSSKYDEEFVEVKDGKEGKASAAKELKEVKIREKKSSKASTEDVSDPYASNED